MSDLQPVAALEKGESERPCSVVLVVGAQHTASVAWPAFDSPFLAVRQAVVGDLTSVPVVDLCVVDLGSLSREQWQQLLGHRAQMQGLIVIGPGDDARLLASEVDDALIPACVSRLEARLLLWRDMLLARQLREHWSDLQRVESLKNEFLATVHHELRTPLTSILGSLSLLSGKVAGELPPKAGVLIDMAFRNAQRLSRLIDDVLDVAKLEEERIELHRKTCEVAPMLVEALAANQAFADKAGVKLRLDASTQAVTIRVDSDRFAQVLANLLSNAIKHSKTGDEVLLASSIKNQRCRVSVQDQGPGIPANFKKRLFEKFSQADGSDRRAKGGTGLGLYISRLLVQRMGGDIGVNSEPGQGACFYVDFPLDETRRSRNE